MKITKIAMVLVASQLVGCATNESPNDGNKRKVFDPCMDTPQNAKNVCFDNAPDLLPAQVPPPPPPPTIIRGEIR